MAQTDPVWPLSFTLSPKDGTESDQQSGSRSADLHPYKGTSLLCIIRDISTLH